MSTALLSDSSHQETNAIYRKPACPWGKKAIDLLKKKQIDYEDHIFSDKAEEEDFKKQNKVSTTPQIWLDNQRIGGYSELADTFGENVKDADSSEKQSYLPVIAIFTTTALITLSTSQSMMSFMGYSLCFLACLKLMNIPGFVNGFKEYDLLTPTLPAYGYAYPFFELLIGLAFLSGIALSLFSLLSIIIGLIGGISVIKAVYIDKRDLNCACVGGDSQVPLGAISFLENAMMVGMGVWIVAAGAMGF